jgi:hypothetical protein
VSDEPGTICHECAQSTSGRCWQHQATSVPLWALPDYGALRRRVAELEAALQEVRDWRGLDGDGISDPTRQHVRAALSGEPNALREIVERAATDAWGIGFVRGSAWQMFRLTGSTAFPSERDAAEEAARSKIVHPAPFEAEWMPAVIAERVLKGETK